MRMGAAALGAVGSLSGCSAVQDLIPGGGGGLGSYTNWGYASDTYDNDDETLSTTVSGYSKFFSSSGKLSESAVRSAKQTRYPNTGIEVEDVAFDMGVPDGRVISGSFDTESVKAELTASPVDLPTDTPENPEGIGGGGSGSVEYESDSTYNDNYEIFVQSEPDTSPVAYAVGNGTVIRAEEVTNQSEDGGTSVTEATEVVEGIIDTGTNGSDRLVDSNDGFSTLTSTLNDGVRISLDVLSSEVGSDDGPSEYISNGLFEGLVAYGQADSINGNTTQMQFVFVFDSEGDVSEGDIQEWVEANDSGQDDFETNNPLAELSNISVNTDSNTATVTGELDTIEYYI